MARSVRLLMLILAVVLIGALATSASAATPSHPRNPTLDVEGLSHACGVAVDSKGDLYASSAGASKVEIFSAADHETPIGEVANANEPCGVAVTSTGVLYVSERKTGAVVRYKPVQYPFVGTPSYGSREVIDASAAGGISVDPRDDRLYVAAGNRIDAFNPDGTLGINEVQRAVPFGATGGTYKLLFEGQETVALPYKATHLEVQKALEGLAAIGVGNVSVSEGTPSQEGRDHIITFVGALVHTDLPQITCDKTGLEGGSANCITATNENGFSGHIGEGSLAEAIGVAAYTYKATASKSTYYLAVAEGAGDQLKIFSAASFRAQKLRHILEGPKEGEEFGFGAQGAYLGADSGTCPPSGQACTAGHFLLYDDAHEVLDEFEAEGELVSQTPFAFGDGGPTAIAVDRSGGANNGALYATSGSGAGARALAFSPLGTPSRSPLKEQSLTLKGACGIAIDEYGNRYVAASGPEVKVYGPSGSAELTKVPTGATCQVAVDSAGNVYALVGGKVVYFKPSTPKPEAGTTYGSATTVSEKANFTNTALPIESFGLNPANDHVFATNSEQTIEYGSASAGSGVLNPTLGAGLTQGAREAVTACGKTGDVYLSAGGNVYVLNPAGTEVLNQISGVGSPAGTISPHARAIAVDRSSCHLFAFEPSYKAGYDFESSGTFLAGSGTFTVLVSIFGAAIDNGLQSPNRGDAYVAFDDTAAETFDLSAFGGLGYPAAKVLPKFLLTVKKTGTGSGTVTSSLKGISCGETCSHEYEEGEKVTLTAAPAEGSEFKGWSGCDTEPEGNCKVAMGKAREVTAAFAEEEPVEPGVPLTVSLEGSGSGTVTSSPGLISCEPFCSDEFEAGTVVTLTASPSPGSLFMTWKHCDKGAINGRQCTMTMSEAKQVQAVFITAHLLTVAKAEGSGPGKVSSYGGLTCLYACTQTSSLVKEGTAVVVKETPAKHFHFAGWSGDCSGTGACELSMGEDHEVLADFQEDPRFSLSLAKAGGGQALIKTKPAGILCAYTCLDAVASFYEGEAIEVSWKLNKGTTKLTWSTGAGTCTGSSEALEGSCTVSMSAAEGLVATLE